MKLKPMREFLAGLLATGLAVTALGQQGNPLGEEKTSRQEWEVQFAGEAFFATLRSEVRGMSDVNADGVLGGGLITLEKESNWDTRAIELGARGGRLFARHPKGDAGLNYADHVDRFDLDFRVVWGPDFARRGDKTHVSFQAGYRFYHTEIHYSAYDQASQKDIHAPFLGLRFAHDLPIPGNAPGFRWAITGEINGLAAFRSFTDEFRHHANEIAPGYDAKGGLLFEVPVNVGSATWRLFAEGGWKYETIFLRGQFGEDTYYGPYGRAGVSVSF